MSASISGRFISMVMAATYKSYLFSTLPSGSALVNTEYRNEENLNLQYHRHNQWPPLCLPRDIPLQIGANFFFDHAIVRFLFGAGGIQRLDHDLFDAFDHRIFTRVETARHDLGRRLDAPGQLVDRYDGHHEAIFAQVAAVLDDDVLDHVGARAGIDADAAYIDASGLAGALLIDFEDVSTFDQHHLTD